MPTSSTPSKSAPKPKATPSVTSRASSPSAARGPRRANASGGATAAGSSKRTVAAPTGPEPLELVRPLIRVRQTREFENRRVTRAQLEAVTEVARWSGSSRNEQPCRFVAIRDRALIRELAELGLPQTRGLRTATAAVAIVLPDEPSREVSRAFDDGRAAERMLIAAHLLGLGGGISRVRRDVREGIDAALGLPAHHSVRTFVALGHPTKEARLPKSQPGQARLPRSEVVFEEHWPEEPSQG